ncbi:MAG TPA: hypothetical protein VHY91_22100 [Pirellulales bacterium]|jgi:predicted aspartyl protease|nr:hypothetical protein [Pirellulales bacterium]
MPVLNAAFMGGSPLVQVAIGVSMPRSNALVAAGRQPPNPQLCLALLDTGASGTCVDPSILTSLALTPTGSTNVVTPSSAVPHQCGMFDVSLIIFMNNQQLHLASLTIPVMGLPLVHQGFAAIIGRDVLAQGMLVYNGKQGQLTLSF